MTAHLRLVRPGDPQRDVELQTLKRTPAPKEIHQQERRLERRILFAVFLLMVACWGWTLFRLFDVVLDVLRGLGR